MFYIIKPKLDIGFKTLFTSAENSNLLKSLLAGLLSMDEKSIRSVQIQNGELLPEEVGMKFGRTDLRLLMYTGNDKIVNIELQIKRQDDFNDRSLFYWSKLFISDLKAGQEYSELTETVCLNILDFRMFDCEEYHSHFQILEKNRHELLSDKFALHFYELPKIPNDNLKDANLMSLWLRLINAESEEDLKMLEKTENKSIQQAVSFIYHMSADEKKKERARWEEKCMHDEASIIGTARREGIAEGEARGRTEETKNMIKMMRLSGLSEEQINSVLAQRDNI